MKVALIQPPAHHFPVDRLKHLLTDSLLVSGIPYFLSELGLKFEQFKPRYFPLGLANISTPLINNGIDVRIFDANIDENVAKGVKSYSPDVIGFSCKTAPSLAWIDKMSRVLKGETEAKIVMGGPHVTIAPRQSLETTASDFVVIGDGDEVFLKLVQSIEKKRKPPKAGVGYKKNGRSFVGKPVIVKDLDSLHIPDRSIFDMKKYRVCVIQKSRGCNNRCGFCYLTAFNGCWRTRSAENVLKEVDYIRSEFGDYKFLFADENLTADLIGMRKLCRGLAGKDVWWETEIGRFLSREDLNLMEKAGCRYAHIGIDAPPGWFNRLAKYRTTRKILQFSKKIKETKIGFGTSYIAMSPDETKSDLEDMYELIVRTKADFVDISVFRPYPGTSIYFDLVERGFKPPGSFRGWGELMTDLLSLRNLDRLNFTKDETPDDVVRFLFKVFIHTSNVQYKIKQQLPVQR